MAYPPGSFDEIFRIYQPRLVEFFRGRGFSKEDADDLTQETLFRIFRYMETYDDRGYFAAWLFTVAESVCLGEWQKLGTQKRKGVEEPYDEGSLLDRHGGDDRDGIRRVPPALQRVPAQEREIDQSRLRERVFRAIQRLSTRQQQCLRLWMLGHRYKEIGTILKIKWETVKQHLKAARQHLRELLQDFYLPDFD